MAMAAGKWLVLQNAHLAPNIMDKVERILSQSTNLNEKFRLWITTEPSDKLPLILLRRSIKGVCFGPSIDVENN